MIDGVAIKKILTHSDERGFFREIFRFQSEFPNEKVGQLSHSLVKKDIIKAWHGHKYQSQWNYVITGKIKVALYDNRVHSSTFGQFIEFIVGEGENIKAYFFSTGILHGYCCLQSPTNMVYVTSGVYDLSDELRIKQDDIPVKIDWQKQ